MIKEFFANKEHFFMAASIGFYLVSMIWSMKGLTNLTIKALFFGLGVWGMMLYIIS